MVGRLMVVGPLALILTEGVALAVPGEVECESLRTGNVLKILRHLEQERLMRPQEAADLDVAYRFLLALESKIRIVADLPEDRLPDEADALASLARRFGYADTTLMSAADALREEYDYNRHVAAREFRAAIHSLGGE